MTDDHRFQIHLGGIIDLLSNHLYSSPSVYVRELLQNATDAIVARQHLETDHIGSVTLQTRVDDRGRTMLTITDDGIGLTEAEVHRFLATIGASSKREEIDERRSDFIGQFGIGLLSCFVVSDAIDVLTRSAKGGPAVAWRGTHDGSYAIELRDEETVPVGTTVHLVAKEGMEGWFDPERLVELATRFGALLPFPVAVDGGSGAQVINPSPPPWRRSFANANEAREASLTFGRELLGGEFLDVVPIRSEAGGVEGLAYVLPFSPSPNSPSAHRVYLKGMLLSEKAENLLPRWAFFVTCVLDAKSLRPTASRERFYEDASLDAAREALGDGLRRYLLALREEDPRRLEALIAIHYRAIKALAAHDTEFLMLFLDALPFETSMGRMSFGALRARNERIRYATSVDLFRQISQVAAAQGMTVINAGYSYDADILARVEGTIEGVTVERIDAAELADALEDAPSGDAFEELLAIAARTLEPFDCDVNLKRFAPAELPVLYVTGEDAAFARSIDTAKKATGDSLWGGMIERIAPTEDARAVLLFNARNPLVVRLARLNDEEGIGLTVQMLYVQALLLGHHPLRPEEMALLNVGLLELIERGLGSRMLQ